MPRPVFSFVAGVRGFHVLGEVIELHVATRDDHLRLFVVFDMVRAQASVLVTDVHFAIGVKDLAYLALLLGFERGLLVADDCAVRSRAAGLAGVFCWAWEARTVELCARAARRTRQKNRQQR